MSNIDGILSCLDKVKSTGNGKYIACCPAHNDKTPSLGITELDDDRIIMHCFGCGANGVEIVQSLGIELDSLFPEKPKDHYKRERKPFPASQILECLYMESNILMVAARQLSNNEPLSADGLLRVEKANSLIYSAVNYAKG